MNIFKRLKLRSLKKKALAMAKLRQSEAVSDVAIKKEIILYLEIAAIYDKYQFDKKTLNAEWLAIENLRVAADLHDANAQYQVGKRFLEKGKFWDEIRATIYASDIHNQYAKNYYNEAFLYLKSAEDQNHPLAKRLHGLAYINGWGVPQDQENGFKMIIDSIDLEGSWDKATDIFKQLGLNKPEFFNKIMHYRQQNH